MKRACLSFGLAMLMLALIMVPVMAVYYVWLTVTESNGTSYTELALNSSMDIETLADEGYIAANGTDTRVTDSDYNVLPHMLADDRLMWCANITGNSTTQFIFWAGQSALSSFPVIAGHGGYVTINDTADLEPGEIYYFQLVAYFDTSAGADKTIIRKDAACSLNVTATQTLRWTVTGVGYLEASSIASGYHTIVIASDGLTMAISVDDVLKDEATTGAVPDTANDWYLFENDVCPYVYYYDEWVGTP